MRKVCTCHDVDKTKVQKNTEIDKSKAEIRKSNGKLMRGRNLSKSRGMKSVGIKVEFDHSIGPVLK